MAIIQGGKKGMTGEKIKTLKQVHELKIDKDRKLFSANHEEIINGVTTDVYFVKTFEILKELGKENVQVVAEIFARKSGIFVDCRRCLIYWKIPGWKFGL